MLLNGLGVISTSIKWFIYRVGTGVGALMLWEKATEYCNRALLSLASHLTAPDETIPLYIGFLSFVVAACLVGAISWSVLAHRFTKGGGVTSAIAFSWPAINLFCVSQEHPFGDLGMLWGTLIYGQYFAYILVAFVAGDLGRKARLRHLDLVERAQSIEMPKGHVASEAKSPPHEPSQHPDTLK
jgi:hypothetical protein